LFIDSADIMKTVDSSPPTTKSLHYSVLPYQRCHRDALLLFRAAHYGPGTLRNDPDYVDWLFEDQFQSQPGRPALFISKDGQSVVGTQGLLHVTLKAGDRNIPTAWVFDYAVRKDLQRNSGIGSAIALASREGMKVRLATDISNAAVAIALKFGWQYVCDIPLWVRPLDLRTHAKATIPWLTTSGLAAVGQVGLDALLSKGLRSARRHHVELVPTDVFDERADRVWSFASIDYPVICRRDSSYLQWRFDRFPGARACSRFWVTDETGVIGYVVLRIGEHKGLRSAFIVDYLCRSAVVPDLLARVLDVSRSAGATVAYCSHQRPFASMVFRPLGFVRRRSGWTFMNSVTDMPADTVGLLSDPARWFITAGDSNLDHLRALAQCRSSSGLST
jgi:hypothetical protein